MLVTNFHVKYWLYKIVGAAFQLFDVGFMHPVREVSKRELARSVDYIETHMHGAMGFDTQRELLAYCLREIQADGIIAEFGVYKGGTIRYMANRLKNRKFHGFDSFEGLPEAWSGFDLAKGAFDMDGRLPQVPANVELHRGFFDTSLPAWKNTHPDAIAMMHVDCDLYSSTKTILDILGDRLQVGSIVLFDEYFNYPGWQRHEFKAWQEYVKARGIAYEYIGYARQQAAVRITGLQ